MAECGVTREGAAATRLGVVGVRADANDFQTGVVGCVPRGGKRQGSCRDECGLFDKATAGEIPWLHASSLRLRLVDVDSLPLPSSTSSRRRPSESTTVTRAPRPSHAMGVRAIDANC